MIDITDQLAALETPTGPFRLTVRAPMDAPISAIVGAAIDGIEARGVDVRVLLLELDVRRWHKDETRITSAGVAGEED
jgi:hypothetical protein